MHADNWAQKAKSLGYRSRAVFKLIQIIEKIKQIKNPNLILDIGAAPGGWSHYLANKYPNAEIFAIDILEMEEIKGVKFIQEDLRNIEQIDQLNDLKNKFNLVISDLAPNLTGISSIDEENVFELNLLTLEGAIRFLESNGIFIVKTFQNSNLKKFRKEMEKNLKIVQTAKPAASKKQSKEIYLYGIKVIMNDFLKNIFVWLVLGSIIFLVFNNVEPTAPRETISYSQFKQEVLSDRVSEVTYKGDQMTIFGQRLDGSKFKTNHPIYKSDPVLDAALQENGVITSYEEVEQPSVWSQLLVGAFPILLLLAIFFFFMRQMQGSMSGRGGPMSFGKSKAKLMEGGKVKTTFKDVAGCEEAKQDVQELVDYLKDPTRFQKVGGKIPRGVLMVGPPGTGKTLLARATAGEARVPFFSISGSDFVEMFVGVGASRVRDMFDQAKKNSPCIVFIDEIDAVGRHRGAGLGGGHDEREQTLNQLLVEMDGFEANDGIIIVAATNRPDVLDPALLRPGRFDRQVVVDMPDIRGREQILKVHVRKVPLDKNVDLRAIARGTPGFSGADLANLINEAALFAARYGDKKVEQSHLDLAKDKIMMGPERKSMILN